MWQPLMSEDNWSRGYSYSIIGHRDGRRIIDQPRGYIIHLQYVISGTKGNYYT